MCVALCNNDWVKCTAKVQVLWIKKVYINKTERKKEIPLFFNSMPKKQKEGVRILLCNITPNVDSDHEM